MADVNALAAAGAEIRPRVAGIAPAQWDLPTPCTHWRVTDLVVHLIEGSRMALRLLQGASASEARRAFGVAHGSDLPSELDVALAEELAAFDGPDALTMTVHHPAAGDVPGATLIGFRTGDYLLHSWDLARATGGDERLPGPGGRGMGGLAAHGAFHRRHRGVRKRAQRDGGPGRAPATTTVGPHRSQAVTASAR